MMVAMNGIIQNGEVVLDEDASMYNGTNVIVTFLKQENKSERTDIDLSKFHVQTERGRNVDKYMKEIRENDRL